MRTDQNFKTGDIVQLKSGGPKMTVDIDTDLMDGNYCCQWFAGKKLESGTFPAASLVPADEDDK